MSDPISEVVNTTETDDETHSLAGHGLEDVNSASICLSVPVKSEEEAKKCEAAADPLTRQLKRLCYSMKGF